MFFDGKWLDWTPQLVAVTTDPSIGTGGNSGIAGAHSRVGRSCIGNARMKFGTSGMNPGSGIYGWTLPMPPVAPPTTSVLPIGSDYLVDSSANAQVWIVSLVLMDAYLGGVRPVMLPHGSVLGSSPTGPVADSDLFGAAFAAGDQIVIEFAYQCAAD